MQAAEKILHVIYCEGRKVGYSALAELQIYRKYAHGQAVVWLNLMGLVIVWTRLKPERWPQNQSHSL